MRIHLIPNSHIDPVWLWNKTEGIDEVLNTFRSACDRLAEYPHLTFSASSLQFYAWVLKFDPALFQRIQAYVAAGRWEVTGGWWIEADTNLPTELSFAKQAELSRAFVREHFGQESAIAYLPDTFGHPATLPKILAAAGFQYFIFCRPNPSEKPDLPGNLFYWEYDGSRVLAYRLKHHYLQYGITPPPAVDPALLLPLLQDAEYQANPVNCYFFGVGNHGGGPAIAEIEFYNRFIAQQPAGEVQYSSCRRFFEEARQSPNIPVYRGDLHNHAVGCYAVNRTIKQAMRQSEQRLQFTARALEMAGRTADTLTPLWEKTLFNQFHDILPGSCARTAAEQAQQELGGVSSACDDLAYAALKTLSRAAPVKNREGEFRIFNTLPFPVTIPLALESFTSFKESSVFRDGAGRAIPIQEALPDVRCVNRRWEFVATLPACGFESYYFDNTATVRPSNPAHVHFQPGTAIATGLAEITGDRMLCFNAEPRMQVAPLRFLVLADASDTWGHGVTAFDEVSGEFALESAAIVAGPVTSKLYECWRYQSSTITAIYALYEGLPRVYLELIVNWREHRKILKMEIRAAATQAALFLMQGAGGAISRPANGVELPLHHWLWLPTNAGNLAVIQDGAFACDAKPEGLRLTLVRSSLYGYDHQTPLVPADPQWPTDQGEHRFRLCLFATQDFNGEQLEQMTQTYLEPYPVIREGWQRIN